MDKESELTLWLAKHDQLPSICISCGVFTDRKFKAKAVAKQHVLVDDDSGALLGCFFALLGPLGWLLSLVANSGPTMQREKEVNVKGAIMIPQCDFCRAESPAKPFAFDWERGLFGFEVHSRFQTDFMRLNKSDQ